MRTVTHSAVVMSACKVDRVPIPTAFHNPPLIMTPTKLVCRYYIQAEEIVWDYAPRGKNVEYNRSFDESEDVFVSVRLRYEFDKHTKM